ncbi:MAG: hypothetical protein KGS72_25790 [Cyanobacteria bacterium REEB67]|nr:hypothetical protein [Cyanobacteria bacterium REEB67]
MFWNKKPQVSAVVPEPTWDRDDFQSFGSNVYQFPAARHLRDHRGGTVKTESFPVILARFLEANPGLEVSAMVAKDSGGYTYHYTVVMKAARP